MVLDETYGTYLEHYGCCFVPSEWELRRMLTRKQYELLMFIDGHLRTTGFSPSFEEMKSALDLKSKSGIHRLISALEERGFLQRRRHRARALQVIRLPGDGAPMTSEPMRTTGVPATRSPSRGGSLSTSSSRTSGLAASGVALSEAGAPELATSGLASAGLPSSGVASGHAPSGMASFGVASPGLQPSGFSPNVIRGDFSARLPAVRAAREVGAVELPLYGRIAAGLPIEALRDNATIEVPVALVAGGDHYALEVAGDSMEDAGILDGDIVIIRKGETAENGQIVVAMIDDAEVTLKRLRRRGGNSIALEAANARYEPQIFPADRVKLQGRLVALLRRY